MALSVPSIPQAARDFIRETMSVIETEQAHRIAASFAFGRENIIPGEPTRFGLGRLYQTLC